jgi:hypothetical protein
MGSFPQINRRLDCHLVGRGSHLSVPNLVATPLNNPPEQFLAATG